MDSFYEALSQMRIQARVKNIECIKYPTDLTLFRISFHLS